MLIKRGRYIITHKCNLSCPFCLSDSGESRYEEKGVSALVPVFSKLIDNGLEKIAITGGEPFVVPERTIEAVKTLTDLGVEVRVFTNGTYSDINYISKLLDAGCSGFHVSVDGWQYDHDILRGSGTWGKVMNTIANMKFLGAYVRTMTLMTGSNECSIQILIDSLRSRGVDEMYVKEVNTSVGRGVSFNDPISKYGRGILKSIATCDDVIAKVSGDFEVGCDGIGVLPNGYLLSCGFAQEPYGDGLSQDIADIYKTKTICHQKNIQTGEVCCDY